MVVDFLAAAEEEIQKASQPRPSRKPVFLFLQEGQKALIRPLFNLPECIVMMKHFQWSNDRDARIDNICAQEVESDCYHCEQFVKAEGSEAKKLEPRKTFYVPVYVYAVKDTRTNQNVTYTDGETGEEKAISGYRVLELSAYGTIASVFKALIAFYKDEDEHDITVCDFSIEQQGKGQQKSFVTLPKMPKPLDPRIAEKRPTVETFKEAILGARPPVTSHDTVSSSSEVRIPVADGDGYDF